VTSDVAKKLFGDESAIGKLVRLNDQTDYKITGIADEPPFNSQLNYNALLSFATLYSEPGNFMDWNGGEQYATYLQLANKTSAASLEKKLPAFMWTHVNADFSKVGFKVDATLQPLKDLHLSYNNNSSTLKANIYIFSIVAFLILVISCVNYVNLTTAQSMTRFKEIGVRKVLGAQRGQLIRQFLIETILFTTAAFFISIMLVKLLTPAYGQLIGHDLPSFSESSLTALLILFLLIMTVGIIAGSYVSFYLSSFNATKIFRSLLPKSRQSFFRKGLIVAQFTITIGLMACTLVVTLQLRYSKAIDTGFDKDHILVLPLVGKNSQAAYPLLRQKFSEMPMVMNVSGVSTIPYDGITRNGFIPEGSTKAMVIHQLDGDDNLLQTFNIKLVAGEFFSKDRPTLSDGYLINETLAKALDWKEPIGKTFNRNGVHRVIGVVKDFHFASLHDKIEPLIITNKPWDGRYSYLAIKYNAGNVPEFLAGVRKAWKATVVAPFDYWFLDSAFDKLYKTEERFQQIFIYFSALSIILSLAGVFGLVALSIKQRRKEFGIRKVLGAGFVDVIKLTAKQFMWLILLGTLVATPLAWYYMNKWLQDFAYRMQISWWIFAACSSAILFVTLATIGFQVLKATISNPVKSLRTE
jgi:putative ABC transport system permease protein